MARAMSSPSSAHHRAREPWRIQRPGNTRSYCVPIIRELAGKTQMVLSGSKCVASYDPNDGEAHLDHRRPHRAVRCFAGAQRKDWLALHDRRLSRSSPARHSARRDGQRLAKPISLGGPTKGVAYAPSPIIEGDHLLIVSDSGIGHRFDAKTGRHLVGGAYARTPCLARQRRGSGSLRQ